MTDSSLQHSPSIPPIQSASRRAKGPRFSLRLLLAVVTIFGIAFPIWYVWPYVEREVHYVIDATGKPDKTKPPRGETTTSMKRVIGGEPVRHGLRTTRVDSGAGILEITQEFVNGVAHGPYRYARDGFEEKGQYEQGEKTGEWTRTSDGYSMRQNWRAGKRHGETVLETPDGKKTTLAFENGLLTHRDGKPIAAPIFERMVQGEVPEGIEWKALNENTLLRFERSSLAQVVAYLRDFHQAKIAVDPAVATLDPMQDVVTLDLRGIDLATALTLAADDVGLVCDYRNGSIWITRPDASPADEQPKAVGE